MTCPDIRQPARTCLKGPIWRNEIKATPTLIERASFEPGTVVTADAMNCQTQIIDLIIKKKAHYFIVLKANQRTLRYSVEDTLPGMTADDECHSVD